MIRNMSVDGSHDSARVSLSPDDARVRAERAREARSNLAALLVDRHGGIEAVRADEGLTRVVAAEFAELCGTLGLEAPVESDVPPGVCHRKGCGNALSLTGAGPRGPGKVGLWRVRGFCSRRCERLMNLRNVEAVE